MKLLINGLSLAQPLTGIGYYTHYLTNELLKLGLVQDIQFWGHIGLVMPLKKLRLLLRPPLVIPLRGKTNTLALPPLHPRSDKS